MRATSGFDGDDSFAGGVVRRVMPAEIGFVLRWQSIVLGQELAVFTGKDVVCYCSYGEPCPEVFAESQHERCLS